ncbi:WG repeat-containing protein [Anaerosalibacter massiliensis]|uniref:WG repeat-containing protein n=1 Tax=Anaerosalibacter massiliensis TaxID=1347392 RepID=A0A9X2S4W4_9FIRM|nr:WG repeat-containing protein [Anaerosalibacter massiliensis]MCR2043709.1 WG repeat-containing protein [Anaerosalibacter massiliensis]
MRGKKTLILLSLVWIFILTSCVNTTETIEESENINLYPAYKKERNQRKWGYLGENGNFVIEPEYEMTEEFDENGLAKVYLDGKVGLIDRDNKVVLSPIYDSIGDIEEGVFSAVKDDKYYILDIKGNELFSSKEYTFIGKSSNNYIVAGKKSKDGNVKMGYINKNGKVLIKPKYNMAWDFKNGRVLVKTESNENLIIDKSGKIINKLKYEDVTPDEKNETFLFANEDNLFGFLDEEGEVLIEPRFKNSSSFKDGMAIVSIDKDSSEIGKMGVINKEGKFLIKPDFTYISYLGEGLFEASKDENGGNEIFLKKAILDKDGKQLTDFKYYNIGKEIKNGYISVSDSKKTFFLDKEGNKMSNLPEIDGVGELVLRGDIIKALIDDRFSYYDKEGKIIWKEDNAYKLNESIIAKENKYNPNMFLSIYYPKLQNMENKKVEEIINNQIYNLFVANAVNEVEKSKNNVMIKIDYKIKVYNNLLMVQKSSFYNNFELEGTIPMEQTYHIDLKTGRLYELRDLFKPDINYSDELMDIIKKEIGERHKKEEGTYSLEDLDDIEEENFILFKDYLQLYFYPDEIADYADGFQRFNIPYKDMEDILDTNSEFWKALNHTKKGE